MNALKAISSKETLERVQSMLIHLKKYNFIKLTSNDSIKLDLNAENLKESVRREWLLTNVVTCDQPVFQCNSIKTEDDLKSAYGKVKALVGVTPFSLVDICSSSTDMDYDNKSTKNVVKLFSNQFKKSTGTVLRSQTFCSPDNALEFFHKQQRERKIWWRKFSALPGRFHTINLSNETEQCIGIQAAFPWGLETIEQIQYSQEILVKDKDFFEVQTQNKKFLPQVITCETILENITLTYLCDSYEEINEKTDRRMLRFHRKLAPYKVAFAINGSNPENNQNLKDLALLLAKKIRKNGFPVLLLPDASVTDPEEQYLRNDSLGVPYTIFLNDETLKDGIMAIRSRDTTLLEQSHVSLVESYIEKLMKHY